MSSCPKVYASHHGGRGAQLTKGKAATMRRVARMLARRPGPRMLKPAR